MAASRKDEIDFTSPSFNALKALYDKHLEPPMPNARIFNTVNEYALSLKIGRNKEHANSLTKNIPSKDHKTKLRNHNRDPKKLEHLMKVKSRVDGIVERVPMLEKTNKSKQMNILERMENKFKDGPLSILYECVEKKLKLKVWTRNLKGLRGVAVGYLIAFDKHMNLAMMDVDEMFAVEERVVLDPAEKDIMTLRKIHKQKTKKRKWRKAKRQHLRQRDADKAHRTSVVIMNDRACISEDLPVGEMDVKVAKVEKVEGKGVDCNNQKYVSVEDQPQSEPLQNDLIKSELQFLKDDYVTNGKNVSVERKELYFVTKQNLPEGEQFNKNLQNSEREEPKTWENDEEIFEENDNHDNNVALLVKNKIKIVEDNLMTGDRSSIKDIELNTRRSYGNIFGKCNEEPHSGLECNDENFAEEQVIRAGEENHGIDIEDYKIKSSTELSESKEEGEISSSDDDVVFDLMKHTATKIDFSINESCENLSSGSTKDKVFVSRTCSSSLNQGNSQTTHRLTQRQYSCSSTFQKTVEQKDNGSSRMSKHVRLRQTKKPVCSENICGGETSSSDRTKKTVCSRRRRHSSEIKNSSRGFSHRSGAYLTEEVVKKDEPNQTISEVTSRDSETKYKSSLPVKVRSSKFGRNSHDCVSKNEKDAEKMRKPLDKTAKECNTSCSRLVRKGCSEPVAVSTRKTPRESSPKTLKFNQSSFKRRAKLTSKDRGSKERITCSDELCKTSSLVESTVDKEMNSKFQEQEIRNKNEQCSGKRKQSSVTQRCKELLKSSKTETKKTKSRIVKTVECKIPGNVVNVRILKVERGKALVLKRRHVNQLFIRGDNIIMVAYDNQKPLQS